jgi:peptidoglycan hydrolase-like protein with peptidoglycan-binding domain
MSRRALVIWVVAAIVVSSLVTWVANEAIRSPGEVAARSAQPSPAPILVPVVEQALSTKVVTRGTGRYADPQKLSVARSMFKRGELVVTKLPAVGSSVDEGDVLLTVSGRPVFVFQGTEPSYRDLGPGMSGPDVRQLEAALQRLGLDPGSVDGTYDAATGAAVAELYRRHGYAPVVATDPELAAVLPPLAGLVEGASPRGGVQLPADEVVFASSTPVRVSDVPANLGAPPSDPLVTVTSSDVVVDAQVPVEQADLIRKGAEVLIDEPDLGIEATGVVTTVAERPGTNGADGFHVSFLVAVDGEAPIGLTGTSVRLTIPIRSTKTATLTVPLSAVSLGPDGESRVQRADGDSFQSVPVRTGLSAAGFVSVTPLEGTLADGDMVLVGFGREGGGGDAG